MTISDACFIYVFTERESTQSETTKTMKTISQSEFWNLPEVKEQQEIQKQSPYKSQEDISAFNEIKRLLSLHMGDEFAQEYMGDY